MLAVCWRAAERTVSLVSVCNVTPGPRMADYYSTPLKQMNLPGFVDMEKMVRVNRRERQAKRVRRRTDSVLLTIVCLSVSLTRTPRAPAQLALKQSAGSQQPMGKGKK